MTNSQRLSPVSLIILQWAWQVLFVFHFSYNDAFSEHKAHFIPMTKELCAFTSGIFIVLVSAAQGRRQNWDSITNYFRPTTHLAVVPLCHINWPLLSNKYVTYSLGRLREKNNKQRGKNMFETLAARPTLELCTESGKQCLRPLSCVYS